MSGKYYMFDSGRKIYNKPETLRLKALTEVMLAYNLGDRSMVDIIYLDGKINECVALTTINGKRYIMLTKCTTMRTYRSYYPIEDDPNLTPDFDGLYDGRLKEIMKRVLDALRIENMIELISLRGRQLLTVGGME